MKKRSLLFLISICALIFTGCGNENKLVCYEKLNDDEYKQSLIIQYNKEKTKVDSTNIEIVVNIKEIELKTLGCTKETKEECLEELKNKYKVGCDNMLEKCNIENETENGFTFTAKVKDEKLEEYFSEISATLPMNQMKSKLEIKYGLTCE
jgi:hypothetical protein